MTQKVLQQSPLIGGIIDAFGDFNNLRTTMEPRFVLGRQLREHLCLAGEPMWAFRVPNFDSLPMAAAFFAIRAKGFFFRLPDAEQLGDLAYVVDIGSFAPTPECRVTSEMQPPSKDTLTWEEMKRYHIHPGFMKNTDLSIAQSLVAVIKTISTTVEHTDPLDHRHSTYGDVLLLGIRELGAKIELTSTDGMAFELSGFGDQLANRAQITAVKSQEGLVSRNHLGRHAKPYWGRNLTYA